MGIQGYSSKVMLLLIATSLIITGCSSNRSKDQNVSASYIAEDVKTEQNITIGENIQKPNANFKLIIGNSLQDTIHVQATLPLEPDAKVISAEIPMGEGFKPSVDNLYTSKQSYKIKKDSQKVKAWTKQHFSENGFTMEGSGQSVNSKENIKTNFFTFRNIAKPNFTINVSFNDQKTYTLMEYTLNYVYIPIRAENTKVLGEVAQIKLAVGKSDQVSQIIEIKDPVLIKTIISSYNELSYSSGGIHGCLMDDGTRLNMTISLTDGQQIEAVENPACLSIHIDGDLELQDKESALFNYLKGLIPASAL
jgi:hypothetical protein